VNANIFYVLDIEESEKETIEYNDKLLVYFKKINESGLNKEIL
jgi:hypothetical protein